MTGRWLAVALLAVASFRPATAQVPDAAAFQRTFSHREAVVNGVRLHYVIGGTGSPILLVHGFPETWYAWRKVMPLLAKRHTVIVPDLRGAGGSDRPAGPYDTGTMAEDLHQLVLQLGFREIDLVGHDVGVAVSYPYAAAHRDEVRHLVLLDVPPQGTAAFEKLRSQAWNWGFQKIPDMPEALVAGRERIYLSEGFYGPLSRNKAAFTREDVDEYVRAYAAPGAMHAAFQWYRAFDEDIRQNRPQLRTKLPMPVLIARRGAVGRTPDAGDGPRDRHAIRDRFDRGLRPLDGRGAARGRRRASLGLCRQRPGAGYVQHSSCRGRQTVTRPDPKPDDEGSAARWGYAGQLAIFVSVL